MNNRFRFRHWDKRINKMFYPERNDNFGYYVNNSDIIETMQCTAIKDYKGNLIYENDIVRLFGNIECNEINNIHIVKFGDFAMYDYDFQEDFEKGSTAVYGWYLGGLQLPVPLSISLETSGLKLEVIGNIYENKELIGDYENDNV